MRGLVRFSMVGGGPPPFCYAPPRVGEGGVPPYVALMEFVILGSDRPGALLELLLLELAYEIRMD